MSEMSMVKTLELWNEAVTLTEKGNFQDALVKFMALEERADSGQAMITSARNLFNIGQTYFSLGRMEMAMQAFKESLEKDKMLAIAYFMLGCVNLKQNRNSEALQSFDDAKFFLRGNRLIDYKQLGLKFKLYGCEILCNRAISNARLGNDQQARYDFLKAIEARIEPRHRAIEDALLRWQTGKYMEPLEMPSHAVFQPARSKMQVAKEKPNYLGKSQVVAAEIVHRNTNNLENAGTARDGRSEKEQTIHHPPAINLVSGRSALLTDLRKKESRQSLKKSRRVSNTVPPLKPLPKTPSPNLPRRNSPYKLGVRSETPPPRPTSPHPRRRGPDSPAMSRSELGKPPSKPLPPSPRSKSPVPPQSRLSPARPASPTPNTSTRTAPREDGTVTFQLVVSRTVQLRKNASVRELTRAAAQALDVTEDSFTLWYTRNHNLTSVTDEELGSLWSSAPDNKPTVFCYEKR